MPDNVPGTGGTLVNRQSVPWKSLFSSQEGNECEDFKKQLNLRIISIVSVSSIGKFKDLH